MTQNISKKLQILCLGIVATFLLASVNVFSQVGNGTSTPNRKETDNNADQNLKSVARVNPSTLAMEMSLPLASYPGRNGNSLPVGFSYSSKVWRMESRFQWWYWLNTQARYVTDITPRFAERSAAGWTSNLLPPRIDDSSIQFYKEDGQPWNLDIFDQAGLNSSWQNILSGFGNNLEIPCGTYCTYWVADNFGQRCVRFEYEYCENGPGGGGPTLPEPPPPIPLFYIKRLQVAMSDGSTHEFRASDTPLPCGTNQAICAPDMNGTYLAVDGSGMRLVKESAGSTLYLPDGSKYLFDPTTTYIDTKGNKLTFSSITANNQTTNKWTDTLGREINDPMPHNWLAQTQIAGKKTVNLPGLSGQTQEYEITWANLKPRGCETDTTSSCVGANNVTGGALEDQTEKLYYDSKYFCRGNISDDLVTQSNGEVLFPTQESGIRPCSSFDVQRNANGEVILDGSGNAIPYAPRFNPVVLSEVKLPNGGKYIFRYNRFGEITKITYPTGSYETFVHSYITSSSGAGSPAYDQTNRGVTERRVYDGGALQQTWTYSAALDSVSGSYKITTKSSTGSDPNAEVLRSERYITSTYSDGSNYGFNNSLAAMPKEERIYDELGNLRARTLTEYVTKDSTYASRDVRVKKTISVTIENGQALATLSETDYDESGSTDPQHFSHLNAKQTKSYHFLPLTITEAGLLDINSIKNQFYQLGQVASIIQTDYSYDPNYKSRGISSLPIETRVLNPSNTSDVLAKTQTVYDNLTASVGYPWSSPIEPQGGVGTTFDCGVTGVVCWQDQNTSYRGNPTTIRVWNSDSSAWIESHVQYDQFGNAVKTRDPIGNETTTIFENSAQKPYKYAYPTQVITPAPDPTGVHGSNTPFTTSTVYDFNTGLPTSTTDINGQITTMEYNDALLRPTKATAPNGQQTITEYGDSPGNIFVKVSSQLDEVNWKIGYKYFDALLRPTRTRSVDNAGDVYALTCYDNMGRVSKTSNPFRNFTNQTCATSSLEWTSNTFDPLGRPISITTPDGAHVDTAYSLSITGNQIGTVVTVTDQALKQRRSITNALGQLTRVDEPNDAGQLGQIDAPTQDTRYAYDGLNNLTTVTQGVQTRTFVYDSLSRLKSATNPESGTINYSFNNNGNLIGKTDARSITTTYAYDVLNRVKTRTYSDSTPAVSYFYDNVANAKGKLIKVSSSVSTTEYTSFDILGRVTRSKQITDVVTYGDDTSPMIYSYNLAGALVEQQYPSGRVVKNTFDSDGDLQQVQSRRANDNFRNYANAFTYTAAGAVSALRLGNGKWETTQFNNRLQPTQIGLGGSAANTSLMKLNYDYGSSDNNGNVKSQMITVPTVGNNVGFTAVQNYNYDYLNRLKSAVENIDGNPTPSWRQTFLYDRFGNRTFDTSNNNTTTLVPGCPVDVCNPSANPQNNRLIGTAFDSSGNTTQTADNQIYMYDAENKMIQASNSAGILGNYFYDGDGKRVKKVVPNGETTIFVYDAEGKSIAEYSTVVEPISTAKVSYLTNDHLGTPRINTDAAGNIVSRSDYMPFGEEITRTSYSSDSIRKKFSGYERDTETSLDFVEARMYSNRLGRFTTVDSAGPDFKNPQTLNKYQFCLNNPLRYVDKNGKYEKDVHVDLTAVLAYAAGFTREQGNKIGEANQWVDDNPETNPETMSNVKARALYHFTTESRRGELWREFNSYVRNGTNGDAYSALGTFMHAHQDSYSHDGFNPVTGQVSSGLRRGIMTSWDSFWAEVRKVDKTAFDPEKAERMAETSFTNLLYGRGKMSLQPGKFGSFSPNISYDVIRSSVAAWIRATSPEKKKYYLKEIYKKIDAERKRLQEEESKKKKRRN